MNYHGSRPSIFATFYLMFVLLKFTSGQHRYGRDNNEVRLGANGDLYELFKKRLEKFNNEMAFNTDNLADIKFDTSNLADEKPSTGRECLYEEYKKRLDRINDELSLDGKKMFDRNSRKSPINKHRKQQTGHKATKTKAKTKFTAANASRKNFNKVQAKLYPKNQRKDQRSEPRLPRVADDQAFFKNNDFTNLQPYRSASFKDKNPNEVIQNTNDINDANTVDLQPELLKFQTYVQYNTNSNKFRRHSNGNSKVVRAAKGDNEVIPPTLDPLYPSVLTKTFETEINPSTGSHSKNLLSTVASKLNTSQLDLAKKLATITDLNSGKIQNDPQMTQELHKYIANTVNLNTHERPTKESPALNSVIPSMNMSPISQTCSPQSVPEASQPQMPCQIQNTPSSSPSPSTQPQFAAPQQPQLEHPINSNSGSNITSILEKVLFKLEQIKVDKSNNSQTDDFVQPDGAPCEIMGLWISYAIGLRFDINPAPINPMKRMKMSFENSKINIKRTNTRCEDSDIVLNIGVHEIVPPKEHGIMNTSWKFTGNSMKQFGGPFFMISSKRSEKVLATFAGFCRTCGGIDTIFGTWTFIYPSNDCQDITVSIQTKRDIFRRDLLESKHRERLKEVLAAHNKNQCSSI